MSVVCLNFGGPDAQNLDGKPSGAKLLPKDDPLTLLGRSVGLKVFELPNGKVYVSGSFGKFDTHALLQNRRDAEEGLKYLYQQRRAVAHGERAASTAAAKGHLEVPEAPGTAADLDPSLQLDKIMHGEVPAPPDSPDNFMTGKLSPGLAKILPARAIVASFGPEGRLLVDMFQRVHDLRDRIIGRAMGMLEKALENVSEDEIAEGIFRHTKDGTPLSPEAERAYRALTGIADQLYESARAAGVRVAERVKNYFPYVYNVARLTDPDYEERMVNALVKGGHAPDRAAAEKILQNRAFGTSKGKAIQEIMEAHKRAGRADITQTEAEDILKRFVKENNSFVSGHLERERLGGLEPISNARTAYAVAFSRNARRVAEAQVLGSHYEKAYQIIDTIRDTLGERHADIAKTLFDAEVGRLESRMPGFLQGMYDWQAMKLSLSVLANSTQTANVAIRTNLKAYAKGIFNALRYDVIPGQAKGSIFRPEATLNRTAEHARDVGAFSNSLLDDIRFRGMEALMTPEDIAAAQRPLARAKHRLEEIALVAFNYVEAINRSVSVRAGEEYFRQQTRKLTADPFDDLARRRLKELGINPETVVSLLERQTPETAGLMDEMMFLAGKRISDTTQFRATPSTRPLWAQHPLGKVMYQFKQFPLGQAEFMINEVFGKHGDTTRRLRAIAAITAGFPAIGVGLVKAREALFGENLSSDQLNKALEDPTVANILVAGIVASASVGAIGIMADVATTAYLGNKFALNSFFLAPVVSTAINALDIGASTVRGVINADSQEFERAAKTLSREFGGVGTLVRRATLGDTETGGSGRGERGGRSGRGGR